MQTVFVKPRALREGEPGFVPGADTSALVRIPGEAYRPLPADGATVPLDEYWIRRLRDEDVAEADPAAAAPVSGKPAPLSPPPAPALKASVPAQKEG